MQVMAEASHSDTPPVNVSEYLEYLQTIGVTDHDFPAVQPVMQKLIWDNFESGTGPAALAHVIELLGKADHRFHVEGGSWTNDVSWVRGYDKILGPMEAASSLFSQKALEPQVPTSDPRYRNALFHLLSSQTSCYRYWGEGLWGDYGRELCRRTTAILNHDF
jgi:hypothetical protein